MKNNKKSYFYNPAFDTSLIRRSVIVDEKTKKQIQEFFIDNDRLTNVAKVQQLCNNAYYRLSDAMNERSLGSARAQDYITDAQDCIYAHSLDAKGVEDNLQKAINLLQDEAGLTDIYDETVYILVIAIYFARECNE